jgi:hypothetical protein
MAFGDIKRLNSATAQLGSTAAVVYTAPSGTRAQIGTIILHNTTADAKDIQLYSNGSTAASRILYITLGANETYEFAPKVPITLEGSETLQGEASTASHVNIKLFGREESGVVSDSDVTAYVALTNATDVSNLTTFVTGLKSNNLWSAAILYPLRSSQNATSTTVYGLGGGGSYNGTLTSSTLWGASGIALSGTAGLTISSFLDLRRKSIMSFVNGVASGGAFNSYFGFGGAGSGNVLVHVSSSGGRGLGVTQPNLNIANNATSNGTGAYCVCYTGNASTSAFEARTIGGNNTVLTGSLSSLANTCNALSVGHSYNQSNQPVDYLAHTCSLVLVYDGQLTSTQQDTIYTLYRNSLGAGLGLPSV